MEVVGIPEAWTPGTMVPDYHGTHLISHPDSRFFFGAEAVLQKTTTCDTAYIFRRTLGFRCPETPRTDRGDPLAVVRRSVTGPLSRRW